MAPASIFGYCVKSIKEILFDDCHHHFCSISGRVSMFKCIGDSELKLMHIFRLFSPVHGRDIFSTCTNPYFWFFRIEWTRCIVSFGFFCHTPSLYGSKFVRLRFLGNIFCSIFFELIAKFTNIAIILTLTSFSRCHP